MLHEEHFTAKDLSRFLTQSGSCLVLSWIDAENLLHSFSSAGRMTNSRTTGPATVTSCFAFAVMVT